MAELLLGVTMMIKVVKRGVSSKERGVYNKNIISYNCFIKSKIEKIINYIPNKIDYHLNIFSIITFVHN